MPRVRLALLSLLPCLAAAPAHVTVDFAEPADYPLSKSKFGLFNSGMVRPGRYARDMPLYDAVRPDHLRVDLGWGADWIGWASTPVGGTAARPAYDFAETDRVARLLRDHGVPAYWSYCYTPACLQPPGGDYRSPPADPAAWAAVLRTMAAHYRAFPGGNPVGYQEVGNEPDNRDFFTGGKGAYLTLYRLGSRAIRDGDPDAVVGGPALAFSSGWVDPFLDSVVAARSPLDFYSFHFYPGVPYAAHDVDGVIRQMRDALAARPSLRTAELHLNEWNPYPIDYPRGGRQDRYPMAADFLHGLKQLLAQPWLTRVSFAQFQDSGGGNYSGMVTMDGHRKAVFNAYAAYAHMPPDRVRFDSDDADVEGLASATTDPRETGQIILWNRSPQAKVVEVRGLHPTWDLLSVGAERIDAGHNSAGDGTPDALFGTSGDGNQFARTNVWWRGVVPAGSVVSLTGGCALELVRRPFPPKGQIIRELHDYPDRASRSYADLDRRTWTARLGMAGEDHATARVGATIDGLPETVAITATLTGRPRPTAVAGVRFDYQGRGGAYTRAVLFLLTNGGGSDAPVWGTARPADRVTPLYPPGSTPPAGDRAMVFGQRVQLDLRHDAPPDWTGRVQVSFVLADAGPDVRATFRLTGG